ncbi:MAG: N-acetyl-gamma-glutamyl-phosphate reductase, partial [Anaerolineae bacterium]|nr:N-acetyl-gamma-glutamyl-phosphate reductase [Anaerolineae bacterium]
MQQSLRVGVYGASGYAGLDLVEILARHPYVELVFAVSNTYAGQPVEHTALTYVKTDEVSLTDVDVVFLALPHGVSAEVARRAVDAGVAVIDLSADLRLDTAEAYQQWYGHVHPHPDMLDAPYGLPEIHRARIAGQRVVAAPGCYPTTTLLGLYPLLKHSWLKPGRPIIVDAKSGVSGAGREPKPNTHFVEVFG